MKMKNVVESRLSSVDFNQLDFGKTFADYMLTMDYDGQSWGEYTMEPLAPMSFHPGMSVFHYGQAIFEGLKAYKTADDRVNIFRLEDNLARLNKSAERLMMPMIDVPQAIETIKEFVRIQHDWVPTRDQGSLYIRPLMISTDDTLRAISSKGFKFIVIACPVGFYFNKPLRILVNKEHKRAATGGIGYAKAAGNYAASFYPTNLAKQQGYDQVLWTDITNNYTLEELGAANFFYVKNGELYTPEMRDSILDGVTRKTLITLAKEAGLVVHEEMITADTFKAELKSGEVDCMFATGTAAAITFVNDLTIDEESFHIKSNQYQPVLQLLQDLDNCKFGLNNHPEWNIWV